jgi:hypothetical protein
MKGERGVALIGFRNTCLYTNLLNLNNIFEARPCIGGGAFKSFHSDKLHGFISTSFTNVI